MFYLKHDKVIQIKAEESVEYKFQDFAGNIRVLVYGNMERLLFNRRGGIVNYGFD